jgi:hypothetical protein
LLRFRKENRRRNYFFVRLGLLTLLLLQSPYLLGPAAEADEEAIAVEDELEEEEVEADPSVPFGKSKL